MSKRQGSHFRGLLKKTKPIGVANLLQNQDLKSAKLKALRSLLKLTSQKGTKLCPQAKKIKRNRSRGHLLPQSKREDKVRAGNDLARYREEKEDKE